MGRLGSQQAVDDAAAAAHTLCANHAHRRAVDTLRQSLQMLHQNAHHTRFGDCGEEPTGYTVEFLRKQPTCTIPCTFQRLTLLDISFSACCLRKLCWYFDQVSDEGNIYVGRGWDWANTYANHTLAITFMGDYGRYQPTAKQLEGVQFLLAHAVANHKLDLDYKLVAQNQVSTLHPFILPVLSTQQLKKL